MRTGVTDCTAWCKSARRTCEDRRLLAAMGGVNCEAAFEFVLESFPRSYCAWLLEWMRNQPRMYSPPALTFVPATERLGTALGVLPPTQMADGRHITAL
jgi:hypothetical protein